MAFDVTNRKNWLIAGFIASVLVLLVALLLILSYRSRVLLADSGEHADRAVEINDRIHAAFTQEIGAIVGFQATGQPQYTDLYEQQVHRIDTSLKELQPIATLLGTSVQNRFKDLKTAMNEWHGDQTTRVLAKLQLPKGKFRQVVFERLYFVRRVHDAMSEFNDTIVAYESAQRARVERMSSLFRTLAIMFGPLALLALGLIAHILRRLDAATYYLDSRAREEEALRRVGQSLTGALTLNDVLERITQAAAVAADSEGVFIETVDARKRQVVCAAAQGEMIPTIGTTSCYEGSLTQGVLQAREPQIIQSPRRSATSELPLGEHCTAMVVPLMTENQALGAIFLIRLWPRRFTYADIRKVRVFADMASLAMHRAVTVERTRKMEAQARFSAETLKTLTSSLDYKATLKTVTRLAVSEVADFCVIFLLQETRIEIVELAHRETVRGDLLEQLRHKYRPRPDRPDSVEEVIRTGRPVLVSEVTDELIREHSTDDEHFDLFQQLHLKSSMLVPLIADSEIFGTMAFLRSGDSLPYDADDLLFAQEIAGYAALAIRNARLYSYASDAIQARDEVLRVVSHDLRNPVNNIQLSAKILGAPSIRDEKRQSILQMIRHSTERMSALIEDLLTISRLREGQKLPLEIQTESPADIVDEACEGVGFQVASRSIDFECQKPPTIPPVKADRRRILQVLYNLLDNALKFTHEGGRIVVSCDESDTAVVFSVKDTGLGIETTDVNKIFDLFWQSKSGTHLGSGLGLAIAKGIVEQHHGRIWAESKPGLGTKVSFTLPRADLAEAPVNLKVA